MHFLFDLAIWVLFQSRFSDVSRDVMLQYLSLLPAHWFARHCMIWKVAQMISCSKRMDSPSQQFTSAFGDLVNKIFPDSCSLNSARHPGPKNMFGHVYHKFQIVKIPNWISNMCRIHTPNYRHWNGISGTYPCGVPAAGPLREDAIIVGKSKLVRPGL